MGGQGSHVGDHLRCLLPFRTATTAGRFHGRGGGRRMVVRGGGGHHLDLFGLDDLLLLVLLLLAADG